MAKEDRDKAVEKFFNLQKKALQDIVPKGRDRVIDLPGDKDDEEAPDERQSAVHHRRRISYYRKDAYKKWLFVFGAVFIFVGAVSYAAVFLPTADIGITLKQTPKSFEGQVKAAVSGGDIPMQVFSETKNAQLEFPASGRERIARKARGTISICNAFNSSPQALVATTRLETSQGIIFRLDQGITVPAAAVKDGKIEPKCIDASVSSDKAGSEYNIGPVPRWTIPGFKGSPRYDGFYGVAAKGMSQGFVGEAAVPTKSDIEKAKLAARKKIEEIIKTAIEVRAPKDLTVLPSDSGFAITKETVLSETDEKGNFKYFIEAKDERIAVREADIEEFFAGMVREELGNAMELASSKIDFVLKSKKADSSGSTKEAILDITISGGFVKKTKAEDIKNMVAGKSESELRAIFDGDDIENAKIALWPFWVKRVPKNLGKINVTIENGSIKELQIADPTTPPASSTR